jgi:hypothetical protein
MYLLFMSLVAIAIGPTAAWAQIDAAPPIDGVLGKIDAVTSDSIEVQTKDGLVHVALEQPVTTYRPVPSDLSHVTSSSYVGVPSEGEPNGVQRAKLILIFPPELRGAAEGSVLQDTPKRAATQSRMTNGSVLRPIASRSRMTNGTVQKGGDTTLVVQYQDGAQTFEVPKGVPVDAIVPQKVKLSAGDIIYAATTKRPDGTLATDRVFQFVAAAPASADTRH